MKKKNSATPQDKKDWIKFTTQSKHIYNKDKDLVDKNIISKNFRKLDLHGFSLKDANKEVKNFIINSYENNYKKLLIVTGKGLRSKVHKNPYISTQMSTLKNSVPEYIKNNEDLFTKISKISKADTKDGGEGAFYIFLK